MESISNLINDDPWLKMPKGERIALRRQRREKLRVSDFRPVESQSITFTIPNTPYGVRKVRRWAPIKRKEPVPVYRMWFEDLVKASEEEIPVPVITVEAVQRVVAFHFGISRTDMISDVKTKDLVWPRHIAIYLSKTLTTRSLPDIARRFGGRDHTTALFAFRKIERLALTDKELASDIATIKRELQVWT